MKTKNALLHYAGIDTDSRCFDCERISESVEPCMRLDTVSGETLHVMICADCIADLETVYEDRLLHTMSMYAARCRRTPEYQDAKSYMVSVMDLREQREEITV